MHIVLINKRVMPYNLLNDELSFKISVINNRRMTVNTIVSGNIYGNIGSDGEVIDLGVFETNEFGVAKFLYPTNDIPDRYINTANFWASGYYKDKVLNSSKARCNFIHRQPEDDYIIDAGTCDDISIIGDRADYRIYDGDDPRVDLPIFDAMRR